MAEVGHNGGPPLEEPAPKFSKRKWALKIFEHPEKPVGAVAMAFKLYMEMDAHGRGAAVSDVEFALCCGVSLRSSWTFKRWLLSNGFVEVKVKGGRARRETEFIAHIPGDEIPAMVADVMGRLPAQVASEEGADCEQPLLANRDGTHANSACDQELRATVASDQPDASRTRVEYNNLNNITTYPTDSEFGERGLGGKPLLPQPIETVLQKLSEIESKLGETRKRGKRESADDDGPTPLDALEAFNAYNELAQKIGLPTARTLTPQRRKNLVARLREHGGIEAWRIALAHIERSAFLRGRNDRGWRCDFDFLIQASRFSKVVDGTYGNGAHAESVDPEESPQQRMRRLMAEATSAEKRDGH